MAPITKQAERAAPAKSLSSYKAVILYSVFSDWTLEDTVVSEEAVSRMRRGLGAAGREVSSIAVYGDIPKALKNVDPRDTIIFNWCEGLDGNPNAYEAVPPVLEQLGFAYTGAGAWSLEASQHKARAKQLLLENKIPTPVSKVYERAVLNGWRRYPAIVKPANEHCSFGITPESVVDSAQQLKERVQYVIDTWKGPALIEDFIDGPEFNVSIWGGNELSVLPLAVIDYSVFDDYHERLCSFDAKWNPDSDAYRLTGVQCPAPIDLVLKRRIEKVALNAFRALQLRDYGRVDIRIRNGVPYVLDVNANPDITMEGGFARSARVAGYDYGQMTAKILDFAAARRPSGD
jgi:D-alanine-D-alanine ligase